MLIFTLDPSPYWYATAMRDIHSSHTDTPTHSHTHADTMGTIDFGFVCIY